MYSLSPLKCFDIILFILVFLACVFFIQTVLHMEKARHNSVRLVDLQLLEIIIPVLEHQPGKHLHMHHIRYILPDQ